MLTSKKPKTGLKFGKLTVLDIAYREPKRGRLYYRCRCDCGKITIARSDTLNYKNKNRSCGCVGVQKLKEMSTTHNKSNTRLFRIWDGMKGRCNYPTSGSFKNYGARGITVCKEWNDDFVAFYDWAIRSGYERFLTLDRINPDLGYCPENCRWATKKEQANNRRNNKKITFDGQTHTVAEWEAITGVDQYNIYNRLRDGWTIKDALTIPVKVYKCGHKRRQNGSLQHTEED